MMLDNKVAVVTDAASGNGGAIAKVVACDRAAVVCAAIIEMLPAGGFDEDPYLPTSKFTKQSVASSVPIQFDARDCGQVRVSIHLAEAEFGRLYTGQQLVPFHRDCVDNG